MTIDAFLRDSIAQLAAAGIPTARLDVLVLLEDELGVDRAHILAHPERDLTHSQQANLHTKVMQRLNHLPLAYIRGKATFYGREFAVNGRVLVPRPETETMIDLLKNVPLPPTPRIADIGTGSGCIGITAALELAGVELFLCDIDAAALKIARQNAKTFGIPATFRQADLLQHTTEKLDVVLANLPYVPEQFDVSKEVRSEPPHAVFAGTDGLATYRDFWQQVAARTIKPRFVLTESLPMQHHALAALARTHDYAQDNHAGLIQLFAML